MQSLNRILVPVDFSETSQAALQCAAMIGARLGAEIDVMHVWRAPPSAASRKDLLTEFTRSEAGHKMMEWLAFFQMRDELEVHGRLSSGARADVPDAIVEAAAAGQYDLVVMATHGRQGFWHNLTGGITEEVMRRAPCPVVTVRVESPRSDTPSDPDLEGHDVWS